MIQPIGSEHHRILLGVEDQGRTEETAKRPNILRLAVGKPYLGRLPIGTAQGAHDVEQGGNRTIPGLIVGLGTGLIGLVAKHRQVAVRLQS